MNKSRHIFIGDVQWCYKEFKLLLKKLKLKKTDKVYLVWDLINKWPQSYKVIKYLYKNQDRFFPIKWNHELNFLNFLSWIKYNNNKSYIKLINKIKNKKANYLINFIKKWPLYIEDKNFLMIHGGLLPNKDLIKHTKWELTKTREIKWKPWYEYYKEDKKIIYWHWAEQWLRIRKNTIWIDSWCVYWKALTAYIFETWEIIQQSALDMYVNVYKKKHILKRLIQVFK
jgi:bis(5'-nucleosyl)-tetraphosphatase (symmetrical)